MDGDWWGFSLGAAYAPQDFLNFGLGFHFLKGDVDAGRAYDADSTAWRFDLGLAANLGSGRYRPLLTGTVSHTVHDYDQTRRADGYIYKSSPDIQVTTVALGWKPAEPLELELRAAWLHDFGDRSLALTSVARDLTGLNVSPPAPTTSAIQPPWGASASFDAGSGFSLGLDYDGQFNGDLDSHQIWGSLKYTF